MGYLGLFVSLFGFLLSDLAHAQPTADSIQLPHEYPLFSTVLLPLQDRMTCSYFSKKEEEKEGVKKVRTLPKKRTDFYDGAFANDLRPEDDFFAVIMFMDFMKSRPDGFTVQEWVDYFKAYRFPTEHLRGLMELKKEYARMENAYQEQEKIAIQEMGEERYRKEARDQMDEDFEKQVRLWVKANDLGKEMDSCECDPPEAVDSLMDKEYAYNTLGKILNISPDQIWQRIGELEELTHYLMYDLMTEASSIVGIFNENGYPTEARNAERTLDQIEKMLHAVWLKAKDKFDNLTYTLSRSLEYQRAEELLGALHEGRVDEFRIRLVDRYNLFPFVDAKVISRDYIPSMQDEKKNTPAFMFLKFFGTSDAGVLNDMRYFVLIPFPEDQKNISFSVAGQNFIYHTRKRTLMNCGMLIPFELTRSFWEKTFLNFDWDVAEACSPSVISDPEKTISLINPLIPARAYEIAEAATKLDQISELLLKPMPPPKVDENGKKVTITTSYSRATHEQLYQEIETTLGTIDGALAAIREEGVDFDHEKEIDELGRYLTEVYVSPENLKLFQEAHPKPKKFKDHKLEYFRNDDYPFVYGNSIHTMDRKGDDAPLMSYHMDAVMRSVLPPLQKALTGPLPSLTPILKQLESHYTQLEKLGLPFPEEDDENAGQGEGEYAEGAAE